MVVLDWWHAAVRLRTRAADGPRALASPTHTWPPKQFADWSGRSGAFGTDVGRDVGANSRLCAAGCSVPTYTRGWYRAPGAPRQRVVGLPRAKPGSAGPVHAARRRNGEPISTAFVESSVNEIIAKRMNKKQQMRWNRATVQSFLDVRTTVLNDTLEDAFRQRYPGFRPANDDEEVALAA